MRGSVVLDRLRTVIAFSVGHAHPISGATGNNMFGVVTVAAMAIGALLWPVMIRVWRKAKPVRAAAATSR